MYRRLLRYFPLCVVVVYALVVPLIWDAPSADFSRALQAPSSQFIAGTDHYGFDLWTRTALGLRVSLLIGLVAALLATAIGLLVGLSAAVFGGVVDRLLMRLTDAINSIPHLILSVVIVALFRGSIPALVISIAVTHWTQVARIIRSTVLSARESEFVAASYGAGASRRWVLTNHLFPVAAGQAIVAVIMLTPHAVWHESALSFLGLGLQPDFPSLGTLMDQARGDIMLGAWWVLVVPGIALLSATLSLMALVPKKVLLGEIGHSVGSGGIDVDVAASVDTDPGAGGPETAEVVDSAVDSAVEPPIFGEGDAGVDALTIDIDAPRGLVHAVSDASLRVRHGEVHGLIGGSGSGKSTLGRALVGLVPPRTKAGGCIVVEGQRHEAAAYVKDSASRLGCCDVSLVPQAPGCSFTPVRRVGEQLAEILRASGRRPHASSDDVAELLARVHLDAEAAKKFPHQLSGGMAQRAAIAAALATGRDIIVADEPTSALDPQLTSEILLLFRELADDGLAVLLISHDVEDIRESGVCDVVSVMRRGRIVENGAALEVLHRPKTAYTRALLAALPSGGMRLTAKFERG